jgi:hypothetical protein
MNAFVQLLSRIDEEKSKYRYQPGKWSTREAAGHIIDSERVFAYRALRFSRGVQKPLQGFDENFFIANSNYNEINLSLMIEEFLHLRRSTISLFRSMRNDMLLQKGNASGY